MTKNKRHILIFPSVLVLLSVVLFAYSCRSDKENPVPYAHVDISINVNSTQYIGLNSVGGWVYLTGGYRGIIVYRNAPEEFVAFERTCPYDSDISTARVQVENSGMTAIDSTCGSKFILIDGSVYAPPATVGLKQYRTSFDGNILRIFN